MNEIEKNICEAEKIGFINSDIKDMMVMKNSLNESYIKEYYQGKNPTLLKCEELVADLIKDMKINPLKDYTNDTRSLKLADLLKKQFKFSDIFIIWDRSAASAPSIFTLLSVSVLFRSTQDTINAFSKKNGYVDNHDNVCVIHASSTLVSQIDITPEEYMAVLLHEIG